MPSTAPATTDPALSIAPECDDETVVRWKRLRWAARALLGLVIAAWSLLLIAWLVLHWGILPHIQQWREPIEARASRALGVPVRIGAIIVRSGGWVPSFELHDVVLLDPQQRAALRLPRVFAALSPRSLLSLQPRFEQLLIDGAQLEVRRDVAGHLWVAGLEFNVSASGQSSDASDWFFAQHEFVIRGGALRWTDELAHAEPLALTNVALVVRNGLRRHDLHLEATPPAEWGERISVTAQFTQPLLAHDGDWHRWSGQAYLDLPRADVRALRQYVNLPFELSEGVGALRGWFDVQSGQPRAATVDVALRAVTLRLAPQVDPLHIQELQGRLLAQRSGDDVTLALQHLTFLTGDDVRWPQGDLKLHWRQHEGQPAMAGDFSAQRLDIGLMAQIATRLPLGDALRRQLAELNPKGMVNDVVTSWQGPLDAPAHYHLHGQVDALSLAALPASEPRRVGRPGLRGATAWLDASEVGGQAQLDLHGGVLELPGVFEDPQLVLDQLTAQLNWKIQPSAVAGAPPKITVQVQQARFSNVDAVGELTALWMSGPGSGLARDGRYPGHLLLDSKLVKGNAARVFRYLPLGLPAATRQYVEHAVQAGTVASATFHVNGDLWDFPYFDSPRAFAPVAGSARPPSGEAEFRINARLEDVALAYVPSIPAQADTPAFESTWPALAHGSVELALDHSTLEFRNGRAVLGNVEWSKIQGAIHSLNGDATLNLDTAARGPLGEMVQFVNTTPVAGWIGHGLDDAHVSGPADLKLVLGLPLAHLRDAVVNGSVTMLGDELRITADSPALSDARGRIDFSQRGFDVVGATARLLGGDVSVAGGSQPDGSIRFTAQGKVSGDGLRHAADLGSLARAATALSGQCDYRASLALVHGAPELTVTSSLVGMAVDLPAPLTKAAETPLAMRWQSTVDPNSIVQGRATRDTLKFELGNLLQAHYDRDLSGSVARVLRGGIGVMEPAPQPAAGVAASLNLKSLMVDEWQTAADRLFGATDARDTAEGGGYVPQSVALRAESLAAGPRRLNHVSAGLSQDAGVWRANLDADQMNGYLEYRPPPRRGGAGAAGRIYARLSRLSLPKSEIEQVESLLEQPPTTIPALDIVVEDFQLRGRALGRLEVEATNRRVEPGRDAARDWQLAKFNITTPEAQLTASGHWSVAPEAPARGNQPARRAVMDFKLVVSDSGALLDRLGTSRAMRGGKGQLSGEISWLGSPFELDYPSMSGQINVAIDSGQFLKVEPGAARLLGVLSLQSLPRRLSLDFRDVFQEGFAFDNITGDVKIHEGVAQTNNLRIRGVQAAVLMDGSADIQRETQDLRVIVVPEISAATAALAYAVINPAIGLGAFLAQAILNKPLAQAGTREFHVSGPWTDPKVDRVEHNAAGSAPAGEAAASVPPKNP